MRKEYQKLNFINMTMKDRKLTAEQVVQILKKHGTIVTADEATAILDFLYKFGKLTLNHLLNENNSNK